MEQRAPIGAWAQHKLDVLRHYFATYTELLSGQRHIKGCHYIHAWTGPGQVRRDDVKAYIDGIPHVALALNHPFHSYTFIEQDLGHTQTLKALKALYPARDIRLHMDNANTALTQEIRRLSTYPAHQRGLALLAPASMQLGLATLNLLAETRTIEVLMQIPVLAVVRGTGPDGPQHLAPNARAQMDRLWGSQDWQAVFFPQERTRHVPRSGAVPAVRYGIAQIRARRVEDLYASRLKFLGFKYVSRIIVVRDATGQPVNCLVCAGSNVTLAKAADAMLSRMGTDLHSR